jgi:hypothetical protein
MTMENCRPSLATSSWSLLRFGFWLGRTQTIAVAAVRWWHICGLASWSRVVTEFPQPPQQFKAFQPIHSGNRIRQCDSLSGFLVIRKGTTLATKVYRKPTHTGRYLTFRSNNLPHVKRSLIRCFHNRATTV